MIRSAGVLGVKCRTGKPFIQIEPNCDGDLMKRTRMVLLKCGLVVAVVTMSFVGIALAQEESVSGHKNSNHARVVDEIPKGAIDGWNTKFTVSQIPLGPTTDCLYRNGVPLVYQTDYQVNSNVIIIAPSQVPQVGDSLYFSYIPVVTSTRSLSPTPGPVEPAENRDEVSISASREALRNEASNLSTTTGQEPTERRLHLFHGSRLAQQHQIEALTMLSSKLSDGSAGVADGLEGLGDGSATSVYRANVQPSSNGRVMSNGGRTVEWHGRAERRDIPPSGASSDSAIQLLVNRLSAVDPEQIGNQEATQETMPPASTFANVSQPSTISPSRGFHKLRRTSREAIDMLGNRLGIAGASDIPR
jgi:hypothetical protein